MARKTSDSQDSVAYLFEQIDDALGENGGNFLDSSLTQAEVKLAQRELRALAVKYRALANDSRAVGA